MGFNFSNLSILLYRFNEFKRNIEQANQDPTKLLEDEIKRRGITPEQLNELKQTAEVLKKIIH